MRYRVVLADDEEEVLFGIRNNLDWESYGFEVAGAFSNGRDVLDFLQTQEVDIVITDIRMPFMDGIELAKKIRIWQEEAAICFVSTSNDFYREAYDLYAIQYLLKPVKEEAVKQLLDKVSKNIIRSREKKLSFQFRGQAGSIPYGKILYISSREHILSICCMDGTVQECKGKLDEMAMQICGDIFMRCHQSFLVNMYHVDSLIGTDLIVAGQRIPISRRYYAEVKRRYQEILFEEVD